MFENYNKYGDLVILDTTYKTNRLGIPLVFINGVNNNGKTIQFGFGLIIEETIESYDWLFEQFRKKFRKNQR